LLPLYVPPGSLMTILSMMGGCGAAGSLAAMFTYRPVGLFAFAGFAVALNETVTAAYAAPAASAAVPANSAVSAINFFGM
jgi:hypothetical protein